MLKRRKGNAATWLQMTHIGGKSGCNRIIIRGKERYIFMSDSFYRKPEEMKLLCLNSLRLCESWKKSFRYAGMVAVIRDDYIYLCCEGENIKGCVYNSSTKSEFVSNHQKTNGNLRFA